MTLEKYKEKRKFNKTTEPKGEKKIAAKEVLSFVVHKHAASHLHYDFRLQIQGVLKSWAVPKGPSMDPNEKRLAIIVEDHPFEYKDFEGIIPEGNYGAGEVLIWDQGHFYINNDLPKKENENLFIKGFSKGRISFYLKGKKLKGKFSLIKIGKRGENAWMLVKAKDEFSGTDILSLDKSVRSGKKIEDIAKVNKQKLEKKIRKNKSVKPAILLSSHIQKTSAPFNSSKRKKATKITIPPENCLPMLASSVEQAFNNEDWIFEIKWDGYRAMAAIQKGKIRLYSRNKKSFNQKFPSIKNALETIQDNAVIDGEIVALDKHGMPSFQLLQNYNDTELNLVYYVFDILWLNGEDLRNLPLIERKKILKQVIDTVKHNQISFSDHIEEDGVFFFNEVEEKGMEGIIAKKKQGKYYSGKRTSEWLKIKTHLRQEVIICGYTAPRKSRKHFGSLILGLYENGELKYAGHSGGGFDEKSLKTIKEKLDKITTDVSPFNQVPKTNTKATWVKPMLVGEVKFTEWTKQGQMRHPVFLGLREDKTASDVEKEKEIQMKAIIKNKKKKDNTINKTATASRKSINKEVVINGEKLKITNLNKIYFPDELYTKGDVIDYYQKISTFILPYLKNRPESMNRHPNGINEKNFFQKNVKNMIPDWVKTIEVPSESKGSIKYLVCQNEPTLIYMANLGCIEINPWSSRIGSLDNPDYLIIDLDPLDVDFKLVTQTALTVKEVLDSAKIPAFIKTSGSKGLHILVPLGAKYSYETCKNFAHVICKIVNNRLPEITSLERSPKKRKNKVYLDYLQNNHGQTIAAPYCVRPRKGATVSTPLNWDEVNYDLNPKQFTIKNIFGRLEKKGDLLKGLLTHRGVNIEKSLKKLQV
ncbi:MAG: DNA ligase D [Bacteroidetes bacterium]|nr:DNA ligase D [Bacteroidota bacterium]HET6243037.1 DNA ligase D [Bacteroidia bacterium]